jgi:predicted metallo-beta-lactamase superfamily hydrolase
MLKTIRIVPLAAESLGVRSLCTYIETPDVKVLLDAGVSLCPSRFGLPPHPDEFQAIISSRQRISEAAKQAEIITISHYHFDHHTASFEDWLCNWTASELTAKQIYEGKTVLMKNTRKKINYNQRRRGWLFKRTSGRFAKKLEVADGRTFTYGKHTKISFSNPVYHGPDNTFLGWVLMVSIEYQKEKFMFAPDVQGPMCQETAELIIQEKPQTLILGGPPLYLADFKVKENDLQDGITNLQNIVERIPLTILDHHVLREESWRKKTEKVFQKAQQHNHTVVTAAEYLGGMNLPLESFRNRLYDQKPPTKNFQVWMKKDRSLKRRTKPPI